MAEDRNAWPQALELLDELLELDPPARDEKLAALPAEERARVQKLLDADAASGVLDRGVQALAPTLFGELADADQTPFADLSGTNLGPFRALKVLGRGGMGEVYLAERTGGDVQQHVALKVLKRGMDSADIVRRFSRERRILAQLNHPNIARFLDGGLTPDGRPYYAMDLIEGVPLNHHARSLDVRAQVKLVAAIADAVAFAHARLVVHRDLKPGNLLVDSTGRPWVLDFGIAKLLGESDDESTADKRAMSPAYAAPEQILGEVIGVAADVYSLAVVLYELVTGLLPHQRDASSLEGLIRGLKDEETPAPRQVLKKNSPPERARHAGEVDGDLELILLRALAHEPERRYPSMGAFADDLRRWLELRVISARPDTLAYRFNRFVRRNRAAVTVGALSAAAIGAALVIALWQAEVARQHAQRADAEAERARAETVRAEHGEQYAQHILGFMQSLFGAADPTTRATTKAPTVVDVVKEAAARVDRELASDPDLRFAVLTSLGNVALGNADHATAAQYLERAFEMRTALREPTPGALGEVYQALAALRVAQQRFEDAVKLGEEGLALLAPALAAAKPRRAEQEAAARLHAALADAYFYLSQVEKSRTANEEAVRLWRHLTGPDSMDVGRQLYNRSVIEWRLRRYEDGERTVEEALAIHRKHLEPHDFRMGALLAMAARLKTERAQPDEAIALHNEAVAIGRAHPAQFTTLISSLLGLGDALKMRGRFAEARAMILEARAVARQHKARREEGLAERSLGDIRRFERNYRDAVAHYHAAVSAFTDSLGPNNLLTVCARGEMLFSRGLGGDARGALADFAPVDVLILAAAGPQGKEVALTRYYRGRLMFQLGRTAEAIELLQQAYTIGEKSQGKESSFFARTLVAWGLALRAAGDPARAEEARASIEEGLRVLTKRGMGWDEAAEAAAAALTAGK